MHSPSLITFDAYVALFDIEGSLVPVVVDALSLSSDTAVSFVRLWRTKQMERAALSNSLDGERVSFSRATALGLDYAAATYNIEVNSATHSALVEAWNLLTPWPEADEVVTLLRDRGYMIAILSNGDQTMLEALAGKFSFGFDHILSSESAGKYKPHPSVYALPEQMLNIPINEVLHVAGSANDVIGAVACKMPCVWSNRKKDVLLDPRLPALAEFTDLHGLLSYCK